VAAATADSPNGVQCDSNLEGLYTDELVGKLRPSIEQAQAAVRGRPATRKRLAPVVAGYEVARRTRELLNIFPTLSSAEAARRLDEVEHDVTGFNPGEVFGNGPALYPPIAAYWEAFRKLLTEQAGLITAAF